MLGLISGKVATVEIAAAILRKQDTAIDVLAQGSLTTFQGKRAIVGVVMDITERKRAEEKLQFGNTLLTAAMENSPDGILAVDRDARIIASNRRFGEMWHIPNDLVEAGSDTPVLAALAASIEES